jgi:hypothetical protein
MRTSFDIIISKNLSDGALVRALEELLPEGVRVDVARGAADLPTDPGAFWASLESTCDPRWPVSLGCSVVAAACDLRSYPDLKIAGWLAKRLGVDSLCGTYPFAGELDPLDPYWFLACVDGRWHLASAAGTKLMGAYSDGSGTIPEIPGRETVRLVRAVELPADARG